LQNKLNRNLYNNKRAKFLALLFYFSTFFGSKESGEKETAVLTTLGGKLSLRSLKVQIPPPTGGCMYKLF